MGIPRDILDQLRHVLHPHATRVANMIAAEEELFVALAKGLEARPRIIGVHDDGAGRAGGRECFLHRGAT